MTESPSARIRPGGSEGCCFSLWRVCWETLVVVVGCRSWVAPLAFGGLT